MKYISSLDFISPHISIYTDSLGSERLKTKLGGLLSILSFLICFSGAIYFIQDFLKFSRPTVIMNESPQFNVTYKNFDQIPFGVRITDEYGNPYKNPEKLFTLKYDWVTTQFDKKGNVVQVYNTLNISKCNLDRHFSDSYKQLFYNYTSLDTYYCIDWKEDETYDLFGLYGDSGNLYTMSAYLIYQCTNTTSNDCLPIDEINLKLSNIYLEYITSDNILKPIQTNPVESKILKYRLSTSNLNYLRVWLGIHQGVYTTDFGLLFLSEQSEPFYSIVTYKEEFRQINKGLVDKGELFFTIISFQNHEFITYYSRSYMKIQDIVANIGGIVEGILLLACFINYVFGKKLSNLKMIKLIPLDEKANILNNNFPKLILNNFIKEKLVEKEPKEKSEISTSNINFKVNNFLPTTVKVINSKEDFITNALKRMSTKVDLDELKLKWYHKLNPMTCCFKDSKEIKTYNSYIKVINRMISLESILSTVYFTKELPNLIFNEDECVAFKYLLANNKKSVDQKKVSMSIDKLKKLGTNEKLLKKLDLMLELN